MADAIMYAAFNALDFLDGKISALPSDMVNTVKPPAGALFQH